MRTRACAHACFVGVEERLFTLEDRRDTVDAYLCLKTLNTHQKTVEIADARCLSILILVLMKNHIRPVPLAYPVLILTLFTKDREKLSRCSGCGGR